MVQSVQKEPRKWTWGRGRVWASGGSRLHKPAVRLEKKTES